MDSEWAVHGYVDGYVIWKRDDVFNVTDGDPPSSFSGYHELDALLRLKGLSAHRVSPGGIISPKPRGM